MNILTTKLHILLYNKEYYHCKSQQTDALKDCPLNRRTAHGNQLPFYYR